MTRVSPMSNTTRFASIDQESVQPDGSIRYFDTLEVCDEKGDVIDTMTVESSEEERPYLDALTDAGWIVTSRNGGAGAWQIRRKDVYDEQRERVAVALMDENGFAPTSAALDVIMAVIRETDRTDIDWREDSAPGLWRYALDAERALRVLRKNGAR